jgi:hypothetical protein
MQMVASLSGVARCSVDPNALEWGYRLFLLYGDGVMRNPVLGLRRIPLLGTRVNKGKKKGRDSSFQSPGPLYSNSLLLLVHAPFSQATALS